jgi:hypothetical protein
VNNVISGGLPSTPMSLVKKLSRLTLVGKLIDNNDDDDNNNDDKIKPIILGVFREPHEKLSYLCEFDSIEMQRTLEHKKFWLSPHKRHAHTAMSMHENDLDCHQVTAAAAVGVGYEQTTVQINDHDDGQLENLDDGELDEGSGGGGGVGGERVGAANEHSEQTAKLYEFLAENTILDRELLGRCVLIVPYNVSSISSSHSDSGGGAAVDRSMQSFYMGTASGHLLRVNRRRNYSQSPIMTTTTTTTMSEYELYASFNLAKLFNMQRIALPAGGGGAAAAAAAIAINEIVENRDEQLLYLATKERVYQLNVTQLNKIICKNNKQQQQEQQEQKQICSPMVVPSFVSQTLNLTIRTEEQTLILDCISQSDFEKKHEYKTLESHLSSRINWRRNEARLCDYLEHNEDEHRNADADADALHISHHISRYGQLILLNVSVNYSGVYECILDDWRVLRRVDLSLHLSHAMQSHAKAVVDSTDNSSSNSLTSSSTTQENGTYSWQIMDEISREFIEWKNHYYNYTKTIDELLKDCVKE